MHRDGSGRGAFAAALLRNAVAGWIAVSLGSPAAFAGEPDWPAGPYSYIVVDQDLRGVLTEFGRNLRLSMRVSDAVRGRVRGRLPIAPAKEFLDRLCDSYGLVWYFDGTVLHVHSESELRTEVMALKSVDAGSVRQTLEQLGIADPRFPLQTTADVGVLSVSGPPSYLALVQQTLSTMSARAPEAARPSQDLPGRYRAEDRVRVFRGGQAGRS